MLNRTDRPAIALIGCPNKLEPVTDPSAVYARLFSRLSIWMFNVNSCGAFSRRNIVGIRPRIDPTIDIRCWSDDRPEFRGHPRRSTNRPFPLTSLGAVTL